MTRPAPQPAAAAAAPRDGGSGGQAPRPGSRRAAAAGLAAILALHVWVSSGTIAPASVLTPEPFYTDDYALHFGRAALVAAELPRTGRLWAYDPTIMAGYPLGATILDLDNVGTAALMALLAPLSPEVAFKVVVSAVLLLAPLLVWASARRLGCADDEALAAAAAALVVSLAAFTFRIGMFANFAASHLAVLVVALAAHHFARPRPGSLVALVAAGTVGLYVHVLVGLLALVPCALLVAGYARRRPGPTLRDATLVVVALLVLNAPWLVPFLRFAPVVGWTYEHHFFQTGPLADAWRALVALGAWPLVLLGLGALGLARWAARGERPLAVAWGAWVAVLTVAALQGSSIPGLGVAEPAHLIVPLSFALCPPAGTAAAALLRPVARGLGSAGLALLLTPLVFLPHLVLAWRALAPLPPVAAALPPEGYALLEWLRASTDRSARLMVEDRAHLERPPVDPRVAGHPYFGSHLPALLPRLLDRETIGGPYPETPTVPHRADFRSGAFFGEPLPAWTAERLAAQLARYNVGWILAWSEVARADLARRPALVEPLGTRGPFALFRVRQAPSFLLAGTGRVEARLNALAVRDASPGRVVLKYHWYPGMCAEPPLPVLPHEAQDLAMPFVAVENGAVRDFTVRPTRDWLGRCR